MKLSIVIPAYNEQDRIAVTLEQTLSYLRPQAYRSEVIVVSDGSRDGTRSVVEGFRCNGHASCHWLEYFPNRGKGYAVRHGMLRARGELRMFMDADYAVPIDDLEKGLHQLDQGADIAIGSRAVPGARVSHHQHPLREGAAKLYTLIQNRLLGFAYEDTQCGFKLFRQHAADALFGVQRFDSVIFDAEVLWLAHRLGFCVTEFPVRWRHVPNSRIRYDSLAKSLHVFQELGRIKRLHPNLHGRAAKPEHQ